MLECLCVFGRACAFVGGGLLLLDVPVGVNITCLSPQRTEGKQYKMRAGVSTTKQEDTPWASEEQRRSWLEMFNGSLSVTEVSLDG